MVEPSPGTHIIRWRGAWIRLERVREQHQVTTLSVELSTGLHEISQFSSTRQRDNRNTEH